MRTPIIAGTGRCIRNVGEAVETAANWKSGFRTVPVEVVICAPFDQPSPGGPFWVNGTGPPLWGGPFLGNPPKRGVFPKNGFRGVTGPPPVKGVKPRKRFGGLNPFFFRG